MGRAKNTSIAMADKTSLKLCSPLGAQTSAAACGIRRQARLDLAMVELPEGAQTAGVFTRNAFVAAPVVISRAHLATCMPRYLLLNSGNANAGMGTRGEADAMRCCARISEIAGVSPESVLMFSTGVIGEPLPVDKILTAIPDLYTNLQENSWADVARAIMTTDTRPKGASRIYKATNGDIQVCGVAKGSGMIHPNMATMLAFIITDAVLPKAVLEEWLTEAVTNSFNRITVDGDTSTNDSCLLISTGRGVVPDKNDMPALKADIVSVFHDLATQIVDDGEGVTRPFSVSVHQGATVEECESVAYAVSGSPLVKTAVHARDPNWGRILAAIGRAGVTNLNIEKVRVMLNDKIVAEKGARADAYMEEHGQVAMNAPDLDIAIYLGRGKQHVKIYASDLSAEYVRINSNYRS